MQTIDPLIDTPTYMHTVYMWHVHAMNTIRAYI